MGSSNAQASRSHGNTPDRKLHKEAPLSHKAIVMHPQQPTKNDDITMSGSATAGDGTCASRDWSARRNTEIQSTHTDTATPPFNLSTRVFTCTKLTDKLYTCILNNSCINIHCTLHHVGQRTINSHLSKVTV